MTYHVPPGYVTLLNIGALVLGNYGRRSEADRAIERSKSKDVLGGPYLAPVPGTAPIGEEWDLLSQSDAVLNPEHPLHEFWLEIYAYECFLFIPPPPVPDRKPPTGQVQQYKHSPTNTLNWTCEELEKLLDELTPEGLLPVPAWITAEAAIQGVGKGIQSIGAFFGLNESPKSGLQPIENPDSPRDHLWNGLLDALETSKIQTPDKSDEEGNIALYTKLLRVLKTLKDILCPPDRPPEIPPSLLQKMIIEFKLNEDYFRPYWSRVVMVNGKMIVETSLNPFY